MSAPIKQKFTNSVVQKMAIDRDPNTAAQDKYYQCVKTSAAQSLHATPDSVHDHLLKINKVCCFARRCVLSSMEWQPQDHPQGISGVAFALAATLAVSSAGCTIQYLLMINS